METRSNFPDGEEPALSNMDRASSERILASAELKLHGTVAPSRRNLVRAFPTKSESRYDPHRW